MGGHHQNLRRGTDQDMDDRNELYQAATKRGAFRVTTKAASESSDLTRSIPATLIRGIVPQRWEPVRIADHIPGGPTSGPSLEILVHQSTEGGGAAYVDRGALKPDMHMTIKPVTITAAKVAVTLGVVDETLQDFQGFTAYASTELLASVVHAENNLMLNAVQATQGFIGLLTTTGTLTRPHQTGELLLDTLERGIADLRTGPQYC